MLLPAKKLAQRSTTVRTQDGRTSVTENSTGVWPGTFTLHTNVINNGISLLRSFGLTLIHICDISLLSFAIASSTTKITMDLVAHCKKSTTADGANSNFNQQSSHFRIQQCRTNGKRDGTPPSYTNSRLKHLENFK